MPKSTFDSKAESMSFELLPKGDYPWQVVGCDFEISKGRETIGSDVMVLKVAFYKDDKFEHKLAQWSENLIFHESIAWKLNVFIKCSNLLIDGKPPEHGAEIEWTPELVIGLRGWATVGSRVHKDDVNKPEAEKRKYNQVVSWLTNKAKIPRAEVVAKEDEDYPF
jgi:hypothetical protein